MVSSLIAGFLLGSFPSLSIHVEGDGYLRLAKEGRVVYAKSAKLTVEDGQLSAHGANFLPGIRVPDGCADLQIDLEGNVSIKGSNGPSVIGRIVLALFPANAGLVDDGEYMTASARPRLGDPGDGTNGVIRTDGSAPAKTAQKEPVKTTSIPQTFKPQITKPTSTANTKPLKAGAVEITVRPDSGLAGETFTLGEIAEIRAEAGLASELGAIDMGRTPTLGVERGIDMSFVLMKIRMAKLKPECYSVVVPTGAKVRRKGQTITFADFVESAKAAVKEKLGIDVPLTCSGTMSDFEAPMGDLQLVAENCMKSTNSIVVTVSVKVDGRRINSRSISLVPDTSAMGVKAGATVKVLARLKGATVEMTGRAQQGGWVGQTITIVTDTGATQSALVTGPNTVEVKL